MIAVSIALAGLVSQLVSFPKDDQIGFFGVQFSVKAKHSPHCVQAERQWSFLICNYFVIAMGSALSEDTP